jgi:hypothetical protein
MLTALEVLEVQELRRQFRFLVMSRKKLPKGRELDSNRLLSSEIKTKIRELEDDCSAVDGHVWKSESNTKRCHHCGVQQSCTH